MSGPIFTVLLRGGSIVDGLTPGSMLMDVTPEAIFGLPVIYEAYRSDVVLRFHSCVMRQPEEAFSTYTICRKYETTSQIAVSWTRVPFKSDRGRMRPYI